MTNQPPPARPDGDARPLDTCPFCGGTDVELSHTESNWPAVQCNECGACGPSIDLHSDEAIKSWNTRATSPARDAAEGVERAAKILRGWAKAYRDSPEHRFPSDPHAEFFPVDLECAADLLEAAPPKPVPDAVRDRAAEPVAWRSREANKPNAIWHVSGSPFKDETGFYEIEPLYAAPPVRGDREKALQLLQASSCFRGEVCPCLPCACAESLADLSLPVQPGAGERDAVIEECAKVAYSFNAACNSPDMQPFVDACLVQAVYSRDFKIGDAIRSLSRQPPQSSSDGEGR